MHVGYTAGADVDSLKSLIADHVSAEDGSPVLETSSRADLDAAQAVIDRDLRDQARGVAWTGIDDRNNRVLIGLGSDASASDRDWAQSEREQFAVGRKAPAVPPDFPTIPQELLPTQQGDPADAPVRKVDVAVVQLSGPAVGKPDACVFPNCGSPLAGAVYIGTSANSCSLGFPGRWWNAAAQRYDFFMITAGHCTDRLEGYHWSAVYQPSGVAQVIGPTHTYRWGSFGTPGVGSTGDIGTIYNPYGSFWYQTVHAARIAMWGWPSSGWDYWRIASQDIATQGRFGCRSGESSYYTCGSVAVGSTSTNWRGPYQAPGDATWVTNQFIVAGACGIPGDSGGPFVDGGVALGTHTGETTWDGSCAGAYAQVFDDAYWLGVYVNTPF